MSDAGHLDSVDSETLEEMRQCLYGFGEVSSSQAMAMSDEEVLGRMDEGYPGGAAQFNREERDWTVDNHDQAGYRDERWAHG